VSEQHKKTTKELQEHTQALLEEGEKLRQESEKSLARLAMMVHGERISFTRSSPQRTRDMTILYDKLNDEQKKELERIDQALFDMADEVTEREKRTLKTAEEEA